MRGMPAQDDRFARMEFEERVRALRLRGLRASQIAREVGVELPIITQILNGFERAYRKQAQQDLKQAAATYRHEMIDRLERLRAEAWQQIELAKDQKKRTRQEMLKDAEGKVTHQRAKVETLPGETSPSLIGEIRQIELALGQLHGVEIKELPEMVPVASRDVFIITPSQPLDAERFAQLNAAIKKRQNGDAIDVPYTTLPSGGNGSPPGNGNGGVS